MTWRQKPGRGRELFTQYFSYIRFHSFVFVKKKVIYILIPVSGFSDLWCC